MKRHSVLLNVFRSVNNGQDVVIRDRRTENGVINVFFAARGAPNDCPVTKMSISLFVRRFRVVGTYRPQFRGRRGR